MSIHRAGVIVFAMVMMTGSAAVYAAPAGPTEVPAQAAAKHEKTVSFSVRNETPAALKLRCGDEPMTVEPGQTAKVKLPAGAAVTFAEASGVHEAGAILAQANGVIKGSTIAVH